MMSTKSNLNYYVVTNPELGWDCLMGSIYEAESEQEARTMFAQEMECEVEELSDRYIFHEMYGGIVRMPDE